MRIEGNASGPTILMLHGWPDTLALWDGTVAALQADYRCVRFTLPGFAGELPARPMSLAELCEVVAHIVQQTSPGVPVIVLAHDWGCVFAYEFLARFPSLASRLIAVDIGDHNQDAYLHSLWFPQQLMIFAYQIYLASAYTIGGRLSGRLATAMSRGLARAIGYRGDASAITWKMNYPYAVAWFGLKGGYAGAAKVTLTHPTLYLYGEKKPFGFHSRRFLDELAQTPGCAVQGFPCGHWVMAERGDEMNAAIRKWLGSAPAR